MVGRILILSQNFNHEGYRKITLKTKDLVSDDQGSNPSRSLHPQP